MSINWSGALEADLRAMMAADFVQTDDILERSGEARMPRHVFAKLVEIGEKIEMRRRILGLPAKPSVEMPAKLIEPAEVFEALSELEKQSQNMGATYEFIDTEHSEALVSGKKPGDVYARLVVVSRLLDRMDQPATVPNDVFKIAETLSSEAILLIGRLTGTKPNRQPIPDHTGKSPGEVYELVGTISKTLSDLATARPAIAPRGGVFHPPAVTGQVTPGHVRDAINLVVADLLEMRVLAGVTDPFRLSEPPIGKIPSDVFRELEAVHAIISLAAS